MHRIIRASVALLIVITACHAQARFVAVSLSQVEADMKAGRASPQTRQLAGITRILGAVLDVDGDTRSVVIVGEADSSLPAIDTDQLTAALQAIYIHGVYPLVSLDATADSRTSHKLAVRLSPGMGNIFGARLLRGDVALKKIALGLVSARIWGVLSYLDLSAAAADQLSESASARFWFMPKDRARLIQRDGVFLIRRLEIDVKAVVDGKDAPRDMPGEQFAAALTAAIGDVALGDRDIAAVKGLFDTVALAAAIKEMMPASRMQYWLSEHQPASVSIPDTYDTLRNRSGRVTVEGGIDMTVLNAALAEFNTGALKTAVLKSRPSRNAVSWVVPLSSWPIDQGQAPRKADADEQAASAVLARNAGAAVLREISRGDGLPATGAAPSQTVPPVRQPLPLPQASGLAPMRPERPVIDLPRYQISLPAKPVLPVVNGVYLVGPAQTDASSVAVGSRSSRGFSLLLDGEDAQLAPDQQQRLATAAWAVWPSAQSPGISIDPIAWGQKKQLVRYIGNILGLDIARVLRVSDWKMKEAAILGMPSSKVIGFKNVDELSARYGLNYAGASRRFWFVPDNLKFRASDGLLRFDGGGLKLKTEYVLSPSRTTPAEPADQAFADFFSANYDEIAASEGNAVFGELREYAKLVGLMSYLKTHGVPMLWYLMAHRHMVLTENSPGTVDAIVRKSQTFEGMTIEGGVDLSMNGQYLPDAEALAALRAAGVRPGGSGDASPVASGPHPSGTAEPLSMGDKRYTLSPQSSATTGRDADGRRWQTDIAARGNDGRAGIELVRFHVTGEASQEPGEFGKGWKLLVPYRIEPLDKSRTVDFSNVRLPQQMVVHDLVTGEREVLTFNQTRYPAVGYVPEDESTSRVVGLFIRANGTFELQDKLNSAYAFRGDGALASMSLSPSYTIDFERESRLDADRFVTAPGRLKVADDERVAFRNVQLRRRMNVILADGREELLEIALDRKVVGYYPKTVNSPVKVLVLLSNGAFRLVDSSGGETAYSSAGEFQAYFPDASVVTGIRQAGQQIAFSFEPALSGVPRIARARLTANGATSEVRYAYDADGRLVSADAVDPATVPSGG